jgi:2-methylaconitate cis-trans-isomerase PrpF
VATFIAGTLAEQYGSNAADPAKMCIGHPSGCLTVEVAVEDIGPDLRIRKANIGRTARDLQ